MTMQVLWISLYGAYLLFWVLFISKLEIHPTHVQLGVSPRQSGFTSFWATSGQVGFTFICRKYGIGCRPRSPVSNVVRLDYVAATHGRLQTSSPTSRPTRACVQVLTDLHLAEGDTMREGAEARRAVDSFHWWEKDYVKQIVLQANSSSNSSDVWWGEVYVWVTTYSEACTHNSINYSQSLSITFE